MQTLVGEISPSEAPRRPWHVARLFALYVAASALTRGAMLGADVLTVDEVAHLVGSWELLGDGKLYQTFVDNKPPLIYVYYAVAQLLLGRGLLAVHLVTILVTVPLVALAVSAFFRHQRAGVAAALLFLGFSAAYGAADMHAANCEIVMLVPATWAAVLVLRSSQESPRLFVAGLLLGIALLVKHHGLFWAAGLAWVIGWRRAPWLLAGLCVPPAAAFIAYDAIGRADDFVYWSVTFNFGYTGNPILVSEAVSRFAANQIPPTLVTIGLWWAVWRHNELLPRPIRRVTFALLVVTALSVLPGLRFFAHYFVPLYVPLSLAAAPVALRLPRIAAGYAVAAVVIATAINVHAYYFGQPAGFGLTPLAARVAAVVRADVCYAGARLFVWGSGPIFHYRTGLGLSTRFVFPEVTINGRVNGNTAVEAGMVSAKHLIREDHRRLLLADLARTEPTYVFDATEAYPQWRAFPMADFPALAARVWADFEPLAEVEGVRIFRRRGCAQARGSESSDRPGSR